MANTIAKMKNAVIEAEIEVKVTFHTRGGKDTLTMNATAQTPTMVVKSQWSERPPTSVEPVAAPTPDRKSDAEW